MARLSGSTSSLPECICNIFDIGGWMLYQIKAKAVPLICDTCNAEIFRPKPTLVCCGRIVWCSVVFEVMCQGGYGVVIFSLV